jgi:predicted nucleotidyltransferase
MGNIFNHDFRDFIKSLNNNQVDYILVGGYAVILHGYRRTTGDMDIWVRNDTTNYEKLLKAFFEFGLPIADMTIENFLNTEKMDVFSWGRSPIVIEIMTALKGCDFDEAYNLSQIYKDDGLEIRTIHLNTLKQSKKAAGRYKDLDDLEKLSAL